jgi:putative DNA primase/helicase
MRSAAKLLKACLKAGIPTVALEPQNLWPDIPPKGDIYDVVTKSAMNTSEFIERLEQEIHRALEERCNSPEATKADKIPRADVIAHEIAQKCRGQLAFNNETKTWMRYGADFIGTWSVESDEYMESIISSILDRKNITGYNSHSYVTNIVKKLRCLLIVRKWVERSPKELLPFQNGVLEISTGKLLPHSPDYRLTWQLPRNHDPSATDWSGIDAFLDHLSGGNEAVKDILLCYCNAVLKGRSDAHKFLHLIGLGGAGKGTYARLLTDVIGVDNVCSSTLEDFK